MRHRTICPGPCPFRSELRDQVGCRQARLGVDKLSDQVERGLLVLPMRRDLPQVARLDPGRGGEGLAAVLVEVLVKLG